MTSYCEKKKELLRDNEESRKRRKAQRHTQLVCFWEWPWGHCLHYEDKFAHRVPQGICCKCGKLVDK